MRSVPRDRFGTASGIIATTRQAGSSAGIALLGGLFASRLAFYSNCPAAGCIAPSLVTKTAVASAFHDILTAAAAFGVLGILTAFMPIRGRCGPARKAGPGARPQDDDRNGRQRPEGIQGMPFLK